MNVLIVPAPCHFIEVKLLHATQIEKLVETSGKSGPVQQLDSMKGKEPVVTVLAGVLEILPSVRATYKR